ncbi:pyridoxamine 5'-phosphate oxidase family protein [Streptomyces sp. NPDC057638]|uniref:pyridoxamine 5'-phosphate oxidase family protein n=1 Tax=Streptomyces sp. NPDC057638 TaxID=3346190 RepID=UPI0036B81FF0
MEAPRPSSQRITDSLARFEADLDCWVATAEKGRAHLIPLSFVWLGGLFYLSTPDRSRTADNARSGSEIRLAFGVTRDVVLVDGAPSMFALDAMPQKVLDRYAEKFGWDLHTSPGYVGLVVEPRRVLAWREEIELPGRTIMRAGRWLDA